MPIQFRVNGRDVEVPDDGASLLEALRDRLGVRSPKDGCSPQGQCGCCTILVDGQPRVACVTPVRRVSGRAVTTLEGLDLATRDWWSQAFTDAGASQCGFCTPGIIMRLAANGPGPASAPAAVESALLAHLCRCTGWRTIVDAATHGPVDGRARFGRDLDAAEQRAHLEGGVPQRVGPSVALGEGGFADDTAPSDALVAVLAADGDWAVGETLSEARAAAGKVQGRRTTLDVTHPLDVPDGDWVLTLQTPWVEPAYLEPDASWCVPGGEPASPLANGGAFGGKTASIAPGAARQLADRYGRAVRVVLAREDVVRWGPKRPPLSAGLREDGSGVIRVARTPGIAAAIAVALPDVVVEEVDVAGPPTSAAVRAAGWAEAATLRAALTTAVTGGPAPPVVSPHGAAALVRIENDRSIVIELACGPVLDEIVLRSYCIGAAHQALGWVTTEGLAVDDAGEVHDLTIRSFGILRARDTPRIEVYLSERGPGGAVRPVNGSDAVFAAVAAAVWIDRGLPPRWPTDRRRTQ